MATGESSLEYEDIAAYIQSLVGIYSAVENVEHLTKREKEFFAATVIHLNENITNPISQAAVQIYKKYFKPGVTRKEINKFITHLSDKEWAEYDKERRHVTIPGLFYGLDKKKDSFEFVVKVSYDAEVDRQDNNGDQG